MSVAPTISKGHVTVTTLLLLAGIAARVHSKEAGRAALLASWGDAKPRLTVTRFVKPPDWQTALIPGEPDPIALEDTVRYIKFCRTVAGLPNDFILDPELNRAAQWGSLLMGKHQSVAHRLPQPKGMDEQTYALASQGLARSNLGMMYGRPSCLAELVHLQMLDNAFNAWNVGHRRWILNPRLSKLGLGIVQNSTGRFQTFGVVSAFDQSHPRPRNLPFVAWPAPGKFPTQCVANDAPWSVSLNPMLYAAPGAVGVKVRLKNETSGTVFEFGAKTHEVREGRMESTIDSDPFSWPDCVIFRPPAGTKYRDGDVWSVKITGLLDLDGRPADLGFSTEMVDLPDFPFPG